MKMISGPFKLSLPRSSRIPWRVLFGTLVVAAICIWAFRPMLVTTAQQPSSSRALVRHGFTTNGRIEGSVQLLTGENTTFNGGGVLTGDLFVPGIPALHLNGNPNFGGTVTGTGSAQPTNYSVTINSNAQLGHLVTRTDPVAMPTVAAPPAATGTRDVTLNNSTQSPGNFATLRDLTLNGNVGLITVPPGTYRKFVANGGSGFVLGIAGATQPAVYNFNSLLLNGSSQLQVVGPIEVTIATAVTLNAPMGSVNNPLWLSLKVAAGGLTLNGGSALYGVVTAPSGLVTINGNTSLIGNVICDRLTTNGNGLVRILQQGDTTPPVLTIAQPAEGSTTNTTQVAVTGTFSDASATTITINGVNAALQGSNFTASVPLTEGPNALLIVATDAAGNSTQATRHVTRDTVAPTIAISAPGASAFTNQTQFVVSGTVTDATAITVSVNSVVAALTGNAFTATVALAEGANALHISATDAAGNLTQVDRNLTRDTIAPVVTIQSPANATVTAASEAIVSGTFSDANPVTVIVNGVPPTVSQNSFTATVPLSVGPSLLIATAVDAAGNETSAERKITKAGDFSLNVEEPLEGQLSAAAEISVAGTITGTDVQVSINGQPVTVSGATVFGGYTTLAEGTNAVHITATDILGRTTEAVRNVVVDTTTPAISAVVPAASETVSETSTTVSGHISDATTVTVKVNEVAATLGTDGVFTLTGFAVREGVNAIRVEAIDALGNSSIADSVFLGRDHTAPAAPIVFPVSTQTRLQQQQLEGRAEEGALVHIGGGTQPVTAQAADGTGLFFATVNLALGDNVLNVTSVDHEGNVSPAVSLTINSDPNLTRPPGEPVQILISLNDAQKGLINQELPRPLIVVVKDQTGEPASGVAVTFTAVHGGGSFVDGSNQFVAMTDSQGHAAARYLGSSTPGFQYIRADFPNNPTTPVSFSAELLQSTPGAPTLATGVVMDQNLRALPNVLVRLGGQQTRTGADGRFLIGNVAAGPHQILELVGRDQIPFPGRWPNISYDFDVLAGVDNNLGRPLFLPRVNGGVAMPLNANNIITSDTVYELPAVGGLPPIRVTARAGTQVTFPPDVTDKRLSVTRIPVSRTPMTLEDGRAASLYISVQPSGAIFEPALEISFPNLDSLPANEEVLLMSFDHDAGRYVQMGTGHVSTDASVVQSDPGSGIRIGAWHALPPRRGGGGGPGVKEATILSEVAVEGNPALEGKDIQLEFATALGQRGVQYSHANNASGQLAKLLVRVRVTMNESSPPVVAPVEVAVKAAKPKVEIDAGAFDYKTKELFIAEDKEIDLTATIKDALQGSTYEYKCSKPDEKKVTVVNCDAQTGAIKIKGSKVYVQKGSDYDFNAGETSFEIEAKGSLGGNADKAKIKISLVKVTYKEDTPNSGFDSPVRGQIQDSSAVVFNASGNFTADTFKDDTKNNLNKTKDEAWLTTVLGVEGGNQTAKYEVKPDKAADHLKFESDAAAKADVAADTGNKKLTVTGKLSTGKNIGKADETFVKAKLDTYKFDDTWNVGKLNVVVRQKVEVKVAFYFLKNPVDGYRAAFDPSGLDGYLARINNVLTPQTGISYTKFRVYHWDSSKNVNVPAGAANPTALTRDFTDVVSSLDWIYLATGTGVNALLPGLKGAAQAKICDAAADREVFVVWEFEEGEVKPPTTDVVGAFTDGHGTIIVDKEDSVNTLTHEIGHSLFIQPFDATYAYYNCLKGRTTCATDPAHSNVKRELMFATNTGRSGLYIPKADVDQAIQHTTNSDWFKGGIKKRPC